MPDGPGSPATRLPRAEGLGMAGFDRRRPLMTKPPPECRHLCVLAAQLHYRRHNRRLLYVSVGRSCLLPLASSYPASCHSSHPIQSPRRLHCCRALPLLGVSGENPVF
ncbi:hypothetical protein E2C01_041327 [Portunus trituberculatus]|uniref:Uncharacterized protein n=1 Tax=Portunus trituberculatus TaxID=210409 RepID=A0A5B7FQ44_PORTR|nr:hypothetical protein [Portunus trituberculatus]